MFNIHFGTSPPVLTESSILAVEANEWSSSRALLKGYGRVAELWPGKEPFPFDQVEITRTRVRFLLNCDGRC